MSLMFDVIIVGARCAGSPLAMLLARRGYRVLVVDKTQFPSDTVSTHFIWHAGLARAKRWGLLEGICSRGATEERARIIVGADGAHSLVAQRVDAPRYNERPSTSGAWYAYWEGGPVVSDFENYFRDDMGGAAFPTSDGLTCVVAGWRHSA